MRDVIRKVMEAEQGAQRVLEEARAEEARILAAAREQAKERVARARKEAQAEAEGMIRASEQALSSERTERLEAAGCEMARSVDLKEEVRRSAVDAVVRCVSGVDRA